MARSRQTQSKRNNTKTQNKRSTGKRQQYASKTNASFLDDETKRNIGGICIIVLAIVLLVAATQPSNAVVTSFASEALHLTFGVGCYVLPFFLAVVGISFMIHSEREHVSGRASLGLLLIFVSILTILALYSPLVTSVGPESVFNTRNLTQLGGYVGAGIAWVELTLFGQVIATIISVGVIIVSLFVIGFSLNDFKNTIEEKHAEHRRKREEEQLSDVAHLPLGNTAATPGNTQLLSTLEPEPSAFTEAKAHPPQMRGVSSLFEKKIRSGWVDPTIKDVTESSDSLQPTRVISRDTENTMTIARNANNEAPDNQGDAYPAEARTQSFTRKLGQHPEKEERSTPQKQKGSTTSKKTHPSLAVPVPLEGFDLPSTELLNRSDVKAHSNASEEELRETAEVLTETLSDFGILIEVKGWVAGPTVTLFKIALPSGVRVNKITVLSDDIALALAAPGVRIFAPIPGTNFVGIEVPNKVRQNVLLGDVLDHAPSGPLQCAVGKDVEGHNVIMDLARAPHVLIGGTTGSGKSVGINSFIMSMLMRNTPNEVRLILIDPKRVEFSLYNGIPHLYIPVVEDPKDASAALNWGVAEMERRLKLFSSVGARNIAQFNTKVQSGELENENALPFIVIVIDELADLMMNVGKEVEFSISRLAQLARAAGIHLIVATQRPSANVVTGLIKSNITTRIAFTVASGIDSRVILDSPGAENLTNNGDLLFSKPDLAKPVRIQGCYVSEDEINSVVEHLKQQGDPDYHNEILQVNTMSLGDTAPDGSGGRGTSDDPLVWDAADIVVSAGTASTSYIQRRLSVGYSRAGRIMDALENKGIVGPQNGSKAREVLIDALELETLKAFEQND